MIIMVHIKLPGFCDVQNADIRTSSLQRFRHCSFLLWQKAGNTVALQSSPVQACEPDVRQGAQHAAYGGGGAALHPRLQRVQLQATEHSGTLQPKTLKLEALIPVLISAMQGGIGRRIIG